MKEAIITKKKLRQLLFWASVGVSNSKGGAYQNTIEKVIKEQAWNLKFKLPAKPKFRD